MEGWATIRVAGQTDWKRVWLVVQKGSGVEGDGAGPAAAAVQTPTKRKRMSNVFSRETNTSDPLPAKPLISMFTSSKPKDRKEPLLTVYGITRAFGVYPERPELINRSTLLKVEGVFGDDEMAAIFQKREGWVLIMPELANSVGEAAEMLSWIVGKYELYFSMDLFCLIFL
jgi:CCR4-NOT transcriptional complex subunit CAF120